MKKLVLLIVVSVFTIHRVDAQEESCFDRLEKAFNERGAYTIADDIHRNVIVTFFEDDDAICVKGKARVENGIVSSIFIYYDDNSSELFDKRFYNRKKEPPVITNGISEMIFTNDGEKLKVVFIEKIKPKRKKFKEVEIPDDF